MQFSLCCIIVQTASGVPLLTALQKEYFLQDMVHKELGSPELYAIDFFRQQFLVHHFQYLQI